MVRSLHKPKIVVLGRICKDPVGGVVWQVLHYLLGFERLGFEAYYVEWMDDPLPDPFDASILPGWPRVMVGHVMRQYGFETRWVCRADSIQPGLTFGGLSRKDLVSLYAEAEAVVNVTASHILDNDQLACRRRVYLETDPGTPQVRLSSGDPQTWEMVNAHSHHFTFAEDLHSTDCLLPKPPLNYLPTRQPVVLDRWYTGHRTGCSKFTTIAKWQPRSKKRIIVVDGRKYLWSKDTEFQAFIDLPQRSNELFELALANVTPEDIASLTKHGWGVVEATSVSSSLDGYQEYIHSSRGEFTVAKDQNIRLRSGWFSDRSACYLAAGKPVITQDTAFGKILPTGEGLFAFRTMDDILSAFDAINSNYEKHCRAALEIAREYFDSDKVLGNLLERIGLGAPGSAAA